jgi:hypothetical protein
MSAFSGQELLSSFDFLVCVWAYLPVAGGRNDRSPRRLSLRIVLREASQIQEGMRCYIPFAPLSFSLR